MADKRCDNGHFIDETWGKGFFRPEQFVAIVFNDLTRAARK